MNEKEKALAGLWFKRGSKELKVDRDKAQKLCCLYNKTDIDELDKRAEIIKELNINTKGNYSINGPLYCDYGYHITLGNNFFANYNLTIIDGGKVEFGDDVLVGPNCTFLTVNHALEPSKRLEGYEIYKPIKVGNNVWFGSNVVVTPGVTIGNNVVVAAGSIVTKDVTDNVLVAGNPAKVIRKLED